jgi:hypothetical protein
VCAASHIMDSNGCSGVKVFTKGNISGSAANEDFSSGAWLCGLSRLGCLPWCQ